MEEVRRDVEAWREHRSRHASPGSGKPTLPADPIAVSGRSVEWALSTAFDHEMPAIRGSAWSMIAAMNADADVRTELIRLVGTALSSRFRIESSAVTGELISIWLNGVRDMVAGAEGRANAAAARRQFVERRAGPDLAAMESFSEVALEFMHHASPDRRVAAIQVLLGTSEGRSQIIPRLAEIALSDSDSGVRITALRGYIQAHHKGKQPAVMNFLARIVRDDSSPIAMRDIAYEGLYEVGDAPVTEWPIVKASQDRFKFPEDVDWEFVLRCSTSA